MNLKMIGKSAVRKLAVGTGVLRIARRWTPPAAVILRYHSIQDDPESCANSIGVGVIHATRIFRWQMEFLATRFHPVSLDDILLFAKGQKVLPRGAVAVTFDDGYVDNYQNAMPVLNRFGIPATFYVMVGAVEANSPPWFCRLRHAFGTTTRREWLDAATGKSRTLGSPGERETEFLKVAARSAAMDGTTREQLVETIERDLDVEPLPALSGLMMSWDQMRALVGAGHIVGSHTVTHPNVACVGEQDARTELVESKRQLEQEMGAAVNHFSYPHPALDPHWTATTLEISLAAGYQTAVTTDSGPVSAGDHPLALKRTYIPHQKDEFLWHLDRTLVTKSKQVSTQ